MKKALLAIVLISLLLVSCKTVDPVRELPSFDPVIPERPVLREMSDASEDAEYNIRNLIIYATQLEVYGQGWREFYSDLTASVAVKDGGE